MKHINPAHVHVTGPMHVTGVYVPDEHPPENCKQCGLPFNDAEASESGLCGECLANAEGH